MGLFDPSLARRAGGGLLLPSRRPALTINTLAATVDPRAAAVFLSEPAETSFDLRFWLFGTHVRVHPWFWLMAAVLGWGASQEGLLYLGLWVLCVFVSVLLHEFGHIFMGRLFGSHGHIVLHSFGGLAIGAADLNRGWQRFLVSSAGPVIQLILCGIVFVAYTVMGPSVPAAWQMVTQAAVEMLVEINLFWAILNLLPIWPLDGGQMAREVFAAASPRHGSAITLMLSACVAGLCAFQCAFPAVLGQHVALLNWDGPEIYMAIFFGLLCAQSIMGLQVENARRQRYYNEEEEFPWER